MIFRVYINFKPGILDPEAEAIMQTIKNMGNKSIEKIIKGKFFDIHVDDKKDYFKVIEEVEKKVLELENNHE